MEVALTEIQIPILFLNDDGTEGRNSKNKRQFIEQFHMVSGCRFVPFNYEETSKDTHISEIRAFVALGLKSREEVIAIAYSGIRVSRTDIYIDLAEAITEAHALGAKLLITAPQDFQDAIYLKDNLFWVKELSSFSLLFIFKSLFGDILALDDFSFTASLSAELSQMTSNKFILHPFVVNEVNSSDDDFSMLTTNGNTVANSLDRIIAMYNNVCEVHPFLMDRKKSPILNGIFSNKILADLSHKFLIPARDESRIVVLVPFHNAGGFLKECVDSLLSQQYGNFEVILLDDCSDDEVTKNVIELSNAKVRVVRSEERKFALENIVNCLMDFNFLDEDIILVVDGDDYLYHDHVFSMINAIYDRTSCLLTYGQYYSTASRKGHCSPYSEGEFNRLRNLGWRASHLKTFKYKLFSEVIWQDAELYAFKDNNGRFYEMTYDIALMTPMMEVAGFKRCYFNEQVNYIYRIHNHNDAARNWQLQVDTENEIKQKPGFKCSFD